MERLILGIDLCDTYTQVGYFDEEKGTCASLSELFETDGDIPTSLLKYRRDDTWIIGREAVEKNLMGKGSLLDNLISMVRKQTKSTIEGVTYQASELIEKFLTLLIDQLLAGLSMEKSQIAFVTITLQEMDLSVMDTLVSALENYGIDRNMIRIISHTEAYMYYLLIQKPELFTNLSCLFDLTAQGLEYFECRVVRGVVPKIVTVTREKLDEGVSLGVFTKEHGGMIADNVTSDVALRMTDRKIISSVYLTGKGFLQVRDWGTKTIKVLSNRRRLFLEDGLFSMGAAARSMDLLRDTTAYPYICQCEGRTEVSVAMDFLVGGQKKTLQLIPAGCNWYQAHNEVEFYLNDMDSVEVTCCYVANRKKKTVELSLAEFPARPKKASRVRLSVMFLSEKHMSLTLTDMGFGDFYPSSGVSVKQEVEV